jgi:hypothetical protein
MKKKRANKSNRGRKPNRAVLSGIKPDQETWDEIRCRVLWGSTEWAMVALQALIKNGSQLPSNYLSAPSDVRCSPYAKRSAGIYPLWDRLRYEFERAVLNGDFDWFRRQANAIEKGGSPQRAQFNAKVVYLLEHAMCETLGRPENWRPLTDAEREAFPNLRRVPQVVTFTPAGKFTDKMASDIFNALDKTELDGRPLKRKRSDEPLMVEGYQFKKKNRVMDEIHRLAEQLQFTLKKQVLKR